MQSNPNIKTKNDIIESLVDILIRILEWAQLNIFSMCIALPGIFFDTILIEMYFGVYFKTCILVKIKIRIFFDDIKWAIFLLYVLKVNYIKFS